MKKVNFLAFLFLLIFLVYSCEDTNKRTNYEMSNDTIAQQKSFDSIQNNNTVNRATPIYTYTGNIEFWNNSSQKELAIYIKDNATTHYIIIQDTGLNINFTNGNYSLQLFTHGILLQNNNAKYFLGIDANESRVQLQDIKDSGITNLVTDLTGAGLIHNSGPNEGYIPIARVIQENVSTVYYLDKPSLGKKKCDHGDPGASSCSISGYYACSVTCRNGYYACCMEARLSSNGGTTSSSCKCKKDGSA